MKRAPLAAALLAATVLTACRLGPDYAPPVHPDGADAALVSATPTTTTPDAPPDNWWHLYDDSVLDGLIEEAFKANDDLKAAEANLGAARAILEGARNSLFPQTKAEAGGTYGRDPTTDEILELEGAKPQTTWLFNSLMDVSYEVDLFGHVARSVEAAKDSQEAAEATRDGLRITIAAETARAYAQICTYGEQLDVAKHSLDLVTRQQTITQQRHDAGAASDFDVVRAEGLVAQVNASIAPLEGQRHAAVFELTALLGRTPANAPATLQSCVAAPLLKAPMPVGDGATLLRRRPDVRRADRNLATALAQVGIATADLYPRVSLGGFYGGTSTAIDLLATENALSWGVGPSISWTFPNMAGPLAKLHQSKASADAALDGFNSTVLGALKETEQALALYGSELDHHKALATAQQKAQRAFDLARDEFSAGAISQLDQLTTEQTLVSADAAVAASDAAIVQDQIVVFKALGGGWQVPEAQKPS